VFVTQPAVNTKRVLHINDVSLLVIEDVVDVGPIDGIGETRLFGGRLVPVLQYKSAG